MPTSFLNFHFFEFCLQELVEPGEDTKKFDVLMPTSVRPKRKSNADVPVESFDDVEVRLTLL
jgi:hypothetical protein